jgi:hypothetical protein
MVRFLALAGLGILSVGLSGCATLSRDECRQGDWASIGQRDGATGYPPSRIQQHAEACSSFGITHNAAAYKAGWDRGIVLYCTPENGFETGRKNESYHGLCPANLVGPFLAGRQVGERLGYAERRLSSAEERLRNLGNERSRLRDRFEALSRNRSLSEEARRNDAARIRDRLNAIRWDTDRAMFDIDRARADLWPAQEAANAYLARFRR